MYYICILYYACILVMQKKRLDKKAKVNFKFYDIIYWETNNYNTHISQYLKKSMNHWN